MGEVYCQSWRATLEGHNMNFSFNGNVETKVAARYQDKCDLQLQVNITLPHPIGTMQLQVNITLPHPIGTMYVPNAHGVMCLLHRMASEGREPEGDQRAKAPKDGREIESTFRWSAKFYYTKLTLSSFQWEISHPHISENTNCLSSRRSKLVTRL